VGVAGSLLDVLNECDAATAPPAMSTGKQHCRVGSRSDARISELGAQQEIESSAPELAGAR
jgi:hypothetical protein